MPTTQAKLITRSKAKTSIGHRKIVNYLEKISKDESGAPVKWKFSKKGVQYAQGISKRITKGPAEKKVKRLKYRAMKMENSATKAVEKTEPSTNVRRKVGRKKKTEAATETNAKLEGTTDENDDSTLQTDNLIISIRRVNSESAKHGTTERIVTIHPVENASAPEESSQEASIDTTSQTIPKKKRGRPKSIHKLIQEKVKASKLKLSNSKNIESEKWKPNKKCEALLNLEKVVAAKRGRPRKKSMETTDDGPKKEEEGSTSREQSVSRFDSDIESIDSNISGSSSRQKSKIRKTYQGIRLGPRKLLRSQDNLMTRRKKVTLSSVAASKMKRKRTLSSDFELLDEVSLKRKIRREELDDFSRESSIDRDDSRNNASKREEKDSVSKSENNGDIKKSVLSEKPGPLFTKPETNENIPKDTKKNDGNKATDVGDTDIKVKRRGRPPKNTKILKVELEKKSNEGRVANEIPSLRREISPEMDIPKLSKIRHDHMGPESSESSDSGVKAIRNEENVSIPSNTRSVFTFGTLKIIGPGGVKLKGNSPLKQVHDMNTEKQTREKKIATGTFTEKEDNTSGAKPLNVSSDVANSLEKSEVDNNPPSVRERISKEFDNTDEKIVESEIPLSVPEKGEDGNMEKESDMRINSLVTQLECDEELNQNNFSKEDLSELNRNDSKELKKEKSSADSVVNQEEILMQTLEISSSLNKGSSDSKKENNTENTAVPVGTTVVDEGSKEKTETACQQDTLQLQNLEETDETFGSDSSFGKPQIPVDEIVVCDRNSTADVIQSFSKPADKICDVAMEEPTIESILTDNNNQPMVDENTNEEPVYNVVSIENEIKGIRETQDTETVEILKMTKNENGSNEYLRNKESTSKTEDFNEEIIHDENETELKDDSETLEENSKFESKETSLKSDVSVSATLGKENSSGCSVESHDDQNESSLNTAELNTENSLIPIENSEIPGYYFRNVENESKHQQIEQNTSHADEINILEKVSPGITISQKSEVNFEKDENSSSSDLSLNSSGNFTSLKEDHLKVSEESSPEQGDQSTKRKGNKNVSPTQRVFQLRQKASRSPLEIIAMRQSKEEREYLLEQSQRAFKREEKQRRMKTKQQRLDNHFEEVDTGNNVSKDSIEAEQKNSSGCHTVTSVDGVQLRHDQIKERNIELEQQCKPCKVILIDFMRYLNVTEKEDPDLDENSCEKTLEPTDTGSYSLETTVEKDHMESNKEQVEGPTIPETNPEFKKKRRPSARKQAIGYHFNRKLTAEIVRYPEDDRTPQSDLIVPPLRLKIKQNLIYEPKKKLKPGRPAKRKARKSMSPRKKANFTNSEQIFTSEGKTVFKEVIQEKESSDATILKPNQVKDTEIFECVYNQCGFQSDRKNIEKHIYLHLKSTKMTCLRCDKTFKNSSMAYAHSGKEHPSEEVLIEPGEKYDIDQFYKRVKPPSSSGTNQIFPQVEQSPEAVIIKVVLPGSRPGKGCYCCSYCDFSSSLQQDILDHINENHRLDIQYTCSICDKRFIGSKDGIADHYKSEHPNDPISYKSMPDFYDGGKEVEENSTMSSIDKGNIFEKFSDMFPRDKQNAADRTTKTERTRLLEKTSAEADSTTVEHDDLQKISGENEKSSKESDLHITENETGTSEDGIEALAKEYGQITATEETKEDQTIDDKRLVGFVILCFDIEILTVILQS